MVTSCCSSEEQQHPLPTAVEAAAAAICAAAEPRYSSRELTAMIGEEMEGRRGVVVVCIQFLYRVLVYVVACTERL